jgi:Putative auto-transporter adhesin, head GIN domain
MRQAAGATVAMVTVLLAASTSFAWAQTSVIQQNNVSVNREGSSVTVSGQTVTVETATGSGRVVGNGQPGSETRAIGPVSAVNADGAFVVTVKTGAVPGVLVETDKNLLPIVKTDVSNGALDIYTDRSYSVDGRIKVTVTSPNVTQITASGSNEINGEGLSGNTLSITLNGSNHALLTGNVLTMTAQLSGANQLAARGLSAGSAVVRISGSGNAAVDARQRIAAEISGAGAISVYGNPKERSTQVNGAGKINFVE